MPILAAAAMFSLTMPASADPKVGCPTGTGWDEMTVEQAAATIWPALVDQSPWEGETDFQETYVRPYDKNGEGSICVKTMWGEGLNQNANWYGVQQFLLRDNNAGA